MMSKDSRTALTELLKKNPLFSAVPVDTLTNLTHQAFVRSYPVGSAVFWEGDPSQGLYWLLAGTLKAVKYSAGGREQILHLIREGEMFNEAGGFTTLPNPATVIALSDSEVWHIPGEPIRQLIREEPLFAQSIIEALTLRLRSAVDLIEDLSLRSVVHRLARLILEEAEENTLFRPAWYTQAELAARLGTVPDVVQRALRKLEETGLIRAERRQIHILDRKSLAKLVEHSG